MDTHTDSTLEPEQIDVDTHTDSPFGTEYISIYNRAQAIEDGVLVNVTETAKEAGFKIPVALTRSVYDQCVEWTPEDEKKKRQCQDMAGRLWDVLWMGFIGARRNTNSATFLYKLTVVPRPGYGRKRLRTLKCMITGGDQGEPVITIMLPEED